MDEIDSLLSKQSLAEWTLFLEEIWGGDGGVVEKLFLTFTFELLHNLQLAASSILKTYSIHYLSSHEIHSHSRVCLESKKGELGEVIATQSVQRYTASF